MLGRYATLCPHLPELLLAIKRWSRPIGLNSPSPKTARTPVSFSSYAYALMTVGFLQVRWSSLKLSQLTILLKSTWVYCRTCKKKYRQISRIGIFGIGSPNVSAIYDSSGECRRYLRIRVCRRRLCFLIGSSLYFCPPYIPYANPAQFLGRV